MRFTRLCFAFSLLLSGCALEGVVVEKHDRQRPDSSMIGTEGVHSFVFRGNTGTSRQPIATLDPQFWAETSGSHKLSLRDRQGNVSSQRVTPEIFARYKVGDYFSDPFPPVDRHDAKETSETAAQPVGSLRHPSKRSPQIAQTVRPRQKVTKNHHRKRPKTIGRRAANSVRQS